MQYKNTVTGVVIDTPCTVNGGNWVPFDETLARKNIEAEVKLEEAEPQTEEVVDDAPAEITKKQIMQELDAFGVDYDKRANKQTLYDLMMQQGE